ncbi:MAG TPA: molybdopterin-dependent oxidoreductase [Thermoanaerobaculia bacterium]|jgi:anaerobic selenocysteine-containing dehydrogenase|nr:molybdopterin-dependent oxidoreductase [Thermoanaerobaculia bacterium]
MATSPGATIHQSACPLDCPDACSLEVRVENGRVTKLDGDRRNAYTQGFICSKVRHFPELLYGPDRLLYPERRVGRKGEGRFERISWDEALAAIAARLRAARERSGGESILPYCYGGSNGALTHDANDARLFRRLGASRLLRTVCAAATGRAATGLYGKMAGVAFSDYVHARLIVVWGANPSATGIHFIPIVQEAQRQGARLVVVDPRSTALAKQADLHLQPRPGGDLPLALAVIRWLFENGRADEEFLRRHTTGADELRRRAATWTPERAAQASGVPVAEIEAFARLYADAAPAVIRCGWGLERNRNGGSAVASVLALPAVGGKFGVRGGGYTMSNSGAWKLDDEVAIGEPEPPTRAINMNLLGEALLTYDQPPIEVLFVYNSNALATTPDQERVRAGLEREDLFTVVFDQVRTDTALYADVLLPATAFLEHRELARGYGAMVMHRLEPVAEAPGEARPNYEVFAELTHRLGLQRPGDAEDPAALEQALLGGSDANRALLAALNGSGIAEAPLGLAPIQFVDHFPRTADGKAHLVPPDLDREAPHGLYTYQPDPATAAAPLALISPATNRTISSYLGHLRRGKVPLEMHPGDAAQRGLREGDRVRVWNDHGEVVTRLHLNADLRPGVACLPKGLWARHTENGRTANALAPPTLADLGGSACFNDARVEVVAAT